MTDYIKPPWEASRGFFTGVFIGLLSWIIGSVILGSVPAIGYDRGAIIGQFVGALGVGAYCNYIAKKKLNVEKKFIFVITSMSVIVCFVVVYFGGFTLFLKSVADNMADTVSDTNFSIAYMLSFGAACYVFGGLLDFWGRFPDSSNEPQ